VSRPGLSPCLPAMAVASTLALGRALRRALRRSALPQASAAAAWAGDAAGCRACSNTGAGGRAGVSAGGEAHEVAADFRPEVLWAPGVRAPETQTEKLARKLKMLCRRGQGPASVGAKGEMSSARALRAIALASEAEAPLEFSVRWREPDEVASSSQPRDGGSSSAWLCFDVESHYNWTAFRQFWDSPALDSSVASSSSSAVGPAVGRADRAGKPMSVTPNTVPSGLAKAVLTEERKHRRVALALNPNNDTVMSTVAHALAELPRLAASGHTPDGGARGEGQVTRQPIADDGSDLVCILRWPQTRGAARVYAHILRRSALEPLREAASARRAAAAADASSVGGITVASIGVDGHGGGGGS